MSRLLSALITLSIFIAEVAGGFAAPSNDIVAPSVAVDDSQRSDPRLLDDSSLWPIRARDPDRIGAGIASPAPEKAPQNALSSLDSAATITLTTAGFQPSLITVTIGSEVTWYNATTQTVVLRSGEIFQVYLPLIARGTFSGLWTAASAANSQLALSSGETFSGTLLPGGIFTHTFTSAGEITYFVMSSPTTRGHIHVTYDLGASPVDLTVATDLYSASSFLYTGNNPIQTGVVSGTIEARRVAVLRGKALTRDNAPLSGVTISILDHPEFGQTLSRADGMFDMAANGGSRLSLKYEKNGYLPIQRQTDVPWQDYVWLPDVVMIPADPFVTVIDLSSSTPFQVARGSVVSDSAGMRQETLLFPAGIFATMTLPSGVTQTLTILHVRNTEYTVGDNGLQAMPAELPANSAYTYAAEFTVDEATAAGATDLHFSQPIISYNENFLSFTVGITIPMGYYDRSRGLWVASDNGRVVKILSITDGKADLDIDGSGTPATPAALAALLSVA